MLAYPHGEGIYQGFAVCFHAITSALDVQPDQEARRQNAASAAVLFTEWLVDVIGRAIETVREGGPSRCRP